MSSLNWNKDFALEQAADDADLLNELLEIFKDSCKKDLDLIKKGIDEKDANLVCNAAHSIKGAAASLGIIGIRDLTLSIEKDARGGSLLVAEDRYTALEELISELMQL